MFDGEQAAGGEQSDSAKADAENQKQDATKNQDAGKTDAANADDSGTDDPIKKELRARANKLQDERDALLKEKQDRETAEQTRKDKEAAEAGKWEELATKREAELKSAKDEAAALKAENDQLREAMKSGTESGWKALPEAIRKLGEKQHPEDDVLGRWTFLHDADTAALVKELTSKDTARGNGRDPKASGTGKGNDEKALAANANRYRY